ncbi:MAG: hypothetical protein AB1650_03050 [Candidatus Omnitrophota bacterium]
MNALLHVLVLFLLIFSIGCQRLPALPVESSQKEVQSAFTPFIVYQDKGTRENHFVPSGFMPDGKCLKLDDSWDKDCRDGKTCMKVIYDTECSEKDQQWAGIFWLNPANNWGSRKGGFNLEGASKLTFWARGDKGGERVEEFGIGGISGNYPDSDSVIIGPVILDKEWRQYTIDLRGKDLSYISGGFSWTTNTKANPEKCIFYLDSIQYE